MRKLIYLCALMFACSTFSSFKSVEPAVNNSKVKASQFTQVAGYFTRNGYVFEVWVTGIPGTVTDIYNYSSSSPSVTYFTGSIDSGGVLRADVELSDSNSFYYSGRLRATP